MFSLSLQESIGGPCWTWKPGAKSGWSCRLCCSWRSTSQGRTGVLFEILWEYHNIFLDFQVIGQSRCNLSNQCALTDEICKKVFVTLLYHQNKSVTCFQPIIHATSIPGASSSCGERTREPYRWWGICALGRTMISCLTHFSCKKNIEGNQNSMQSNHFSLMSCRWRAMWRREHQSTSTLREVSSLLSPYQGDNIANEQLSIG